MRGGLTVLFFVMVSFWAGTSGGSETPYLLFDLASDPIPREAISFNDEVVEFQDDFYFVATDGLHGYELWRSDGSARETHMVFDVCSGVCSSMPRSLVVAGDRLFFLAWTIEAGVELWSTDGTGQGTALMGDLMRGPESSLPFFLTGLDDQLLFFTKDEQDDPSLWRSDGTVGGTSVVATFDRSVAGMGGLGDQAVFLLDAGTNLELWSTDGSSSGTTQLPAPGFARSYSVVGVASGKVFFVLRGAPRDQLWSSDGTQNGTRFLLETSDSLYGFEPHAGEMYFLRGGREEIWASDGTSQGTRLWQSLNCRPIDPMVSSGVGLFFGCMDSSGREPWFSDGTASGTRLLADTAPGSDSGLSLFPNVAGGSQGALFTAANPGDPTATATWFSDGTATGTVTLSNAGDDFHFRSRGEFQTTSEGWLLRSDARSHAELFVAALDGNTLKSLGLPNQQASSYPDGYEQLAGGRLFFRSRSAFALWPWVSWTANDIAATPFVADPSAPYPWRVPPTFVSLGGRLYFLQNESFGLGAAGGPGTPMSPPRVSELYSATGELADVRSVGSFPWSSWLIELEGSLYARQLDPCCTGLADFVRLDPVSEQAHEIPGPAPPLAPPSRRNEWLRAQGGVFMPSGTGVWGFSTSRGAFNLIPVAENSDSLAVDSVGTVFVSAESASQGREIWVLPILSSANPLSVRPGPESGVFRAAVDNPDPVRNSSRHYDLLSEESAVSPPDFAMFEDHYYFMGDDGASGVELWATNAGGPPFLVGDLAPGPASSYPQNLLAVGDKLFFRADDGVHGSELWVVSETGTPPVLVADLQSGPGSSMPQQFAEADGRLLFSADDGTRGRELWVSDGTPAGTYAVADIAPGPDSSSPSGFFVEPGRVVFTANDGVHGFEVWAVDLPEPGDIFSSGFEAGDSASWSTTVP